MNVLASKILAIKNRLNNKVRWDLEHNVDESTFNLMNDLAGLWCCAQGDEKKYYPAAYECVAKAAIDYFESEIKSHRIYLKGQLSDHDQDSPYQANKQDVKIVWAFEEFCTFDQMMMVLDVAIRYANLIAFS